MYKEVSAKIIMILVTAAILTVPSSVVQYLHAQSDQGLQAVLNIHNQERGLVGVQPLTWSDSLAAEAKSWADHLTTLGTVCAPPPQGCIPIPPHGASNENIALGVTWPEDLAEEEGRSAPVELANEWVKEKAAYNAGQRSGPGIGHYTAMVWQDTREVGCGFSSSGVTDFLVCRYNPQGNAPGQVPFGRK
jgi:pathogenesis-related protein 1